MGTRPRSISDVTLNNRANRRRSAPSSSRLRQSQKAMVDDFEREEPAWAKMASATRHTAWERDGPVDFRWMRGKGPSDWKTSSNCCCHHPLDRIITRNGTIAFGMSLNECTEV